MSELLTQDEIDSLLSAVRKGNVPEAPDISARPRRNQTILPYDFRRPNRIAKEQVRTLQMLHETFARSVSSSLSAYLRSPVEVQLTSVEQLTYGEFMLSIVPPASFGIFEMTPLKGGAVLDVNPHLVFPMIDRILGGGGRAFIQVRELTEIERALVEGIFRRFLVDLRQAWQQVGRFEVRLLNVETNPQFLQLASSNDIAMLVTFDVRVGEVEGVMNLCLPLAMLEPILPKLMTQRWFGASASAEAGKVSAEIHAHLRSTSIGLRAVLGQVRLSIGQLTQLRPGDVLPLPGGPELPVTLEVEGQPCFSGRAGRRQRRCAVEIITTLDPGGEHHV
ncbi:MAG TPA: flagellar motor switch protein FliM [Candidatus Methylomirabilis sp.]|nr:flagellar motor switch protein FliM [Candidatus Methylomirabilis sp.]